MFSVSDQAGLLKVSTLYSTCKATNTIEGSEMSGVSDTPEDSKLTLTELRAKNMHVHVEILKL